MQYLSKEIEAASKRRKRQEASLIRTVHSCGIFQDYGNTETTLLKAKKES